jgi:hypothetical protein
MSCVQFKVSQCNFYCATKWSLFLDHHHHHHHHSHFLSYSICSHLSYSRTDISGIDPARSFHFIVISYQLFFTSFISRFYSHVYHCVVKNNVVIKLLNCYKHFKSPPFHKIIHSPRPHHFVYSSHLCLLGLGAKKLLLKLDSLTLRTLLVHRTLIQHSAFQNIGQSAGGINKSEELEVICFSSEAIILLCIERFNWLKSFCFDMSSHKQRHQVERSFLSDRC